MMIETLGSFKIKGWRKYLAANLYLKSMKPFEWGVNDCMILACDAIKAMTGMDPIANWLRGKYSDKHEAIAVVRGHFGLPFLETFEMVFETMGFQPSEKLEMGDVAFVRIENFDPEAAKLFGGLTLATVFNDAGHVVCPGKDGLVVLSKFEMVKAWKL
jgi:hypothetical protein